MGPDKGRIIKQEHLLGASRGECNKTLTPFSWNGNTMFGVWCVWNGRVLDDEPERTSPAPEDGRVDVLQLDEGRLVGRDRATGFHLDPYELPARTFEDDVDLLAGVRTQVKRGGLSLGSTPAAFRFPSRRSSPAAGHFGPPGAGGI